MTKRSAEYQLNEKGEETEPKTQMKKSTPEEIKVRPILKIKRDADGNHTDANQVSQNKPHFQLAKDDKQPEEKKDEAKTDGKSEQDSKPKSIFGDFLSTSSLFNNSNNSTSIFSQKSTINTGSIFANLVPSNPTGGLFSLFTNNTAETKPMDFSSTLFPNNGQKNSDEEDDVDGGDDNEGNKEEIIDPSKSTGKFVYENPFEKLIEKKAFKFRLNTNDIVDNVDVTVEQFKETHTKFLLIRTSAMKKKLYQGQLIKDISTIKKIANSEGSVELKTVSTAENGTKVDTIRLKFEDAAYCQQFFKCFESSIPK